MSWRNNRRAFAIALAICGLAILIYGLYLSNVNPRTDEEDDFAWCVFSIGAAMAAAGVSLPRLQPSGVLLVALISPTIAFTTIVVAFWAGIIIYAMTRH